MKIKNKVLFVLFSLFCIANLVDLITSYFILPAEANPLFLLFKNIWIVYAIKLFIPVLFYMWYKRNVYDTHFSLFIHVNILMYGILLLSLGAASNIHAMLNPAVFEVASEYTIAQKISGYSTFILIICLIPYGLNMLSFKLYEWSLKRSRIIKNLTLKDWWKKNY